MEYHRTILLDHIMTPAGELYLGSCGGQLCLCDWVNSRRQMANSRRICQGLKADLQWGTSDVMEQAKQELTEYFAGQRQVFSIPVVLIGTAFQRTVWQALLDIPFGQTLTYGGLAQRLGRPTAVRAVAGAVGANALSILVPCHRIVGAGGQLTGYAGGLVAKQTLLRVETGSGGGLSPAGLGYS